MTHLRGLYISSNVNREGKPFCQVTLQHSTDPEGPLLEDAVGQLDPREVKSMALGWVTAAEAAIHDGSVFKLLVDTIGVDPEQAAQLIHDLREHRIDADEMEDEPG